MWFLLVVVLSSDVNVAVVDQYTSQDACMIAKSHFEADFAQSYPNDHDYAFVCLLPTKVI
jgi:hypothetical protein